MGGEGDQVNLELSWEELQLILYALDVTSDTTADRELQQELEAVLTKLKEIDQR